MVKNGKDILIIKTNHRSYGRISMHLWIALIHREIPPGSNGHLVLAYSFGDGLLITENLHEMEYLVGIRELNLDLGNCNLRSLMKV